MTWKLEKALSSIPYDHFDISEEVQEQVEVDKSMVLFISTGLVLYSFSFTRMAEMSAYSQP